MNWREFYENRINQKYKNHIRKKYKDTFDILRNSGSKTFGHFGGGLGNASRILLEDIKDSKHIILDIDVNMLELSNKNLEETRKYNFQVLKHDIRDLFRGIKLDLIHSHGVLEHFQDEEIQEIIKKQLKICNKLVHYVPSYKYEIPSFGDERLLTSKNWYDICKPDKIIESNDGFDITLIWG